jgi:hypothetical protein
MTNGQMRTGWFYEAKFKLWKIIGNKGLIRKIKQSVAALGYSLD